MSSTRHCLLACSVAAAIALAASAPVQAIEDQKSVSASECVPYAPDTTAAEVVISASGVYNPGTSIEKVICPLPRDQEVAYTTDTASLTVYYRVLGAAPGRLTCSWFVGSSNMQSVAVYTTTVVGTQVSGGTRTALQMKAGTQTQYNSVPNTLICAISPKTSLAAIYFNEIDLTDNELPDE